MQRKSRLTIAFVFGSVILFSAVSGGAARLDSKETQSPASSPMLSALVNEAAKTALEKFKDKGLKEENLSITLIDLRDPGHPAQGSFRGNERVYPASVVKLFYLVAAHRLLQDKA